MTPAQVSQYLVDDRCRDSFFEVVNNAKMEKEDWRFVVTPKFISDHYIVSDQGRVASLPRYRVYEQGGSVKHGKFLPGRIMRPGRQPSGHLTITIVYKKEKFRTHVHRLVAWTFLGPQPAEHYVRHLDGNPSNNAVTNLRYGLPWDNITDTFGPSGVTGTGIVIGHSLARRIEAALDGKQDPLSVLSEIRGLIQRSKQNASSSNTGKTW